MVLITLRETTVMQLLPLILIPFAMPLSMLGGGIQSALEIGANIGMNLKALQLLYPGIHLKGVEINSDAAKRLAEVIGENNVFEGSIF